MRASGRYVELDVRSVGAYAAPYLQEPVVDAQEIGDGNLNLVFRVQGESTSVIVKQALPYLRVAGESWPLTRHRARIEAEAISIHDKLSTGVLPSVLDFDNSMSAIVMQDLVGYSSWRDALIARSSPSGVAERVGRYCAQVLLGTSDVIMASRDRKLLKRDFVYSELCLVTEDLVFTAPYINAESNRFDPELSDLVDELHRDRALRAAAAQLRFAFKTRDEALIHGDLHTGSVMVAADGDTRVIDLEFAFFGPFGFDPAMLLANLAFARLSHEARGDFAFSRAVDEAASEYWASLADEASRLWDHREPWYQTFLARLLEDAGRFAGMEMIRRMVGLAHVKDVDSLPKPLRTSVQRQVIANGRELMVGPPVRAFDDLWSRAVTEEI